MDRRRVEDYLESTEWTLPSSVGFDWNTTVTAENFAHVLSEIGRGAKSTHEFLDRVREFLSMEIGYTPRTEPHTFPAWEVINRRRGLCGNLSEVFLYTARLLGVPYRYVAFAGKSPSGEDIGDTATEIFVGGSWQLVSPILNWTRRGASAYDLSCCAPRILTKEPNEDLYLHLLFSQPRTYTTELNSVALASFTEPSDVIDHSTLYGAGSIRHAEALVGRQSDPRPGVFRIPDLSEARDQWKATVHEGTAEVAETGVAYLSCGAPGGLTEISSSSPAFRLNDVQGLCLGLSVKSYSSGAFVRATIAPVDWDAQVISEVFRPVSGPSDWVRVRIDMGELLVRAKERGIEEARLGVAFGVQGPDAPGAAAAAYFVHPAIGTDSYPLAFFGWAPAQLRPGGSLPAVRRRIYWRVRPDTDDADWLSSWFDADLEAIP